MQLIKSWSKLRWLRIGYGFTVVGLAALTGFMFISGAFTESSIEESSNTYIFLFVGLLLTALFINIVFGEDSDGLTWRMRLQSWIRICLFVNWGIAGVLWYLYPEKGHLEPTTFLLTAAIAYVSYQLERNQTKQRNLAT